MIHLLTAHFSVGYHHPDEHFQILEFVNYKLGRSSAVDLPWEFRAQIRPWFEPALFTALVGAWRKIAPDDPSAWAAGLRQFCALLGWLSSCALFGCAYREFGDERRRRWAAFLFCFLWCLPYLQARTSSESLSSSFLFLGVALALYPHAKFRWEFAGALLGLAFECRFQSGFFILGLWAWLTRERRIAWGTGARAALGFALIFALGRLADHWGYGEWTLTPWNYFRANVTQSKASQWGTLPWWGYLELSARLMPPLGLLALLSLLAVWARHPRHVLTWLTLPYVLVHCAIPHKELRFMTPLAWIMPWLVLLALTPWPALGAGVTKILRALGLGLAGFNALVLLALCFMPARPEFYFLDHVLEKYPDRFEYSAGAHQDPYEMAGSTVNFYKPREVVRHELSVDPKGLVYVTGRYPVAADLPATCHLDYSTLSPWEERTLPRIVLKDITVRELYACP